MTLGDVLRADEALTRWARPGGFCPHGCPGGVGGGALGRERALFPFLTKVTGRAKGWGGLGGLEEMSVILPGKLSWGNDQLGDSSSVPAITFTPTPLPQDPALQALATPPPSPSHQQSSSGEPAGARRVSRPKPRLVINGVELEHFFQGEIQAFSPDRRWALGVHSVEQENQNHLPRSRLVRQAAWRCGFLMHAGEETLPSLLPFPSPVLGR